MSMKTAAVAVVVVALAAAGAATAAAVTQKGSGALAASRSNGSLVTLHRTKLGRILATSSGMTLYLFQADRHGRSACYGKCATFWPPLVVKGKARAGSGVKGKLLGVTKRKDGKRQVTYAGHPLYRFKLDKKPGQTAGQAQDFFGGKWFGVSGAGKAIEKAATPPPPTTTAPPATTTGPYGY
jgi:predicted lipoprotein with Yx(FWY)xxD motif